VIFYETQEELRQQLTRARVPTFAYTHAGLADIVVTIRTLGARVGRREEAERVAAGLERAVGRVKKTVEGRVRPRTLLVFGREQGALRAIYASGGIGFLHDMLVAAGGANVFADVDQQRLQITTELIIARAPEVIVEVEIPEDSGASAAEDRRSWSALASVPAVRTGRIHVLRGQRFVQPGPGVAGAIEDMARVLHPGLVNW
jgi:iron complex transport system substrate-binding protein